MSRLFSLLSVFLICTTMFPQSRFDILKYIAQYKGAALEQERLYGIPAPITLAQGILETGAGRSTLARKANNHFGVKAGGGWRGPVFLSWDDEKQPSKFRVYTSVSESFTDHSKVLLASRYSRCHSLSKYDYRGWAREIKAAGYATAPNYAQVLIGYIDTYQLYAVNGGRKLNPGKNVIKKVVKQQEILDDEYVIDDKEETEEQQDLEVVVNRFVVERNHVPCTILTPGETLGTIARKYDIAPHKILEYNEVTSDDGIGEGDFVYLQKKKKRYDGLKDWHEVAKGETLYGIAQQYGITMASLAKRNNLDFFSELRTGQKLWLR